VALLQGKRHVVFVDVVLLDARRKPSHHEESSVMKSDSACPVDQLRHFVSRYFYERVAVIDVDPRISTASG
jgi:hypothetical protein